MELHQQDDLDRRRTPDRRRKALPTLRSLLIYRQRRTLRRASDRRGLALLDYYDPSMMTPVVLILALSVLDAVMTLFLMSHGAMELNPVMAFFIRLGSVPFVLAKYAFTAVSVIIIVVFNYFSIRPLKMNTGRLLYFFALAFAMVIIWEVALAFYYIF